MITKTQTVDLKLVDFAAVNRDDIDEAELASLAETIKTHGILQDVILTPKGKRFECVAGERRIRAARLAGLKQAQAKIVTDVTEQHVKELRLIENIQREELTPWEEAAQLADRRKLKPDERVEDLAVLVGRSPEWVACRLAYGQMSEKLRKLVSEQDWPLKHLPLLARVPSHLHDDLVDEIKQMQKGRWSNWDGGKNVPEVPSYQELSRVLGEIQHELRTAEWDLDDAELLKDAGSCSACPKRAGAQPLLFADLAGAKKDRCLDAFCWSQKETAFIKVGLERLKTAGEEPLVLSAGPVKKELLKELGVKGEPESLHSMTTCKKGDKGARPAFVVGQHRRGSLLQYVKPYSSSSSNGASRGGKRAVDQETGKKVEPTKKERLKTLSLKRQCRAVELWCELLTKFEPDLLTAATVTAAVGTAERQSYLSATPWNAVIKIKGVKAMAAKLWERTVSVLQDRLKRFGAMETVGPRLWAEAESVANILGEQDALKRCLETATKEVKVPKVLQEAGVPA